MKGINVSIAWPVAVHGDTLLVDADIYLEYEQILASANRILISPSVEPFV